ncbi:phenylacetate--CoA ligase [Actinomadura meridiana]|uniref:Phenylacetate-coenzyme A ligase n=2 Tax=Actinomadura meridiana TaxID=559626 RepID=A0ABP8BWB9_9ACTN
MTVPTAVPMTGSVDELRAVQLDRLRWTVRHAYENVPHYRKALDDAGTHPDHIRDLSDLSALPFTTKDDLRANYPYGMFAVPSDQVARIHASSGTTGRPTIVGYTRDDLGMWADVVARSIRAAGGRPGDRLHNAYGYGLFTGGLGLHAGAERLGCTVIPASGGMTERQVRLIQDLRPDIITVTPSYLLALAEEMERQGVDPRSTSLRVAICGAEPWTEELRREVEERLAIDAVDIYGLSEIVGPGVAQEHAETKDGPHLWEDHFYPEIVDPVTGEVLPDGEHGELVLTTLTRQAIPVLRYRTRDLTRLLPGTAGPTRRIARISGRTDDMIILRGVNLFPTQIEELLLGTAELAPHFQCVLTRRGALDGLTVRVERRETVAAPAADEAALQVRARIKNTIGVSVDVEIVAPGGIERSAGKVRRVVDERPRR